MFCVFLMKKNSHFMNTRTSLPPTLMLPFYKLRRSYFMLFPGFVFNLEISWLSIVVCHSLYNAPEYLNGTTAINIHKKYAKHQKSTWFIEYSLNSKFIAWVETNAIWFREHSRNVCSHANECLKFLYKGTLFLVHFSIFQAIKLTNCPSNLSCQSIVPCANNYIEVNKRKMLRLVSSWLVHWQDHENRCMHNSHNWDKLKHLEFCWPE